MIRQMDNVRHKTTQQAKPKQGKPKQAKPGLSFVKQRGFSMIELVVAVLIMGVGVLGVTGLQLVSLQNNRDALLRSEAIQLAYDILDRIRVNPGIGAISGAAYSGVDFDDDPTAPTNCYTNQCTAAEITNFDIAVWQCSLGEHNEHAVCAGLRDGVILPPATNANAQPGLPEGVGAIDVNGASGLVTVSIRYRDFAGNQQTVSIESQG